MVVSIPVRALPLNMIYSTLKSGRRVKSQKYKEFAQSVHKILPMYNGRFLEFRNSFNEKTQYIRCDWVFNHKILTNSGRISKNSGDSSNMIKPIEDLIFGYMQINDAFVKGGTFEKCESKQDEILVTMRIYNL